MPTTTPHKERTATSTEPAPGAAARAVGREHAGRTEDQPILSIRASVAAAEADAFIGSALEDIRVYMQEHDVTPAGPPFSICRPRGTAVDVEAGWPTARPLAGSGRIHSGALPCLLTGPRRTAPRGEPTA